MIQQDFKLVGTSSVVQQCSREVLALSSEFLKSPRQLLSIIIPKCNFECILSEAANFLMSLKIILLISLIKRSCPQLLDIPEGNSVDSSRCLLHVENCEPRKKRALDKAKSNFQGFCKIDKHAQVSILIVFSLTSTSTEFSLRTHADIGISAMCALLTKNRREKFILNFIKRQMMKLCRYIIIYFYFRLPGKYLH